MLVAAALVAAALVAAALKECLPVPANPEHERESMFLVAKLDNCRKSDRRVWNRTIGTGTVPNGTTNVPPVPGNPGNIRGVLHGPRAGAHTYS